MTNIRPAKRYALVAVLSIGLIAGGLGSLSGISTANATSSAQTISQPNFADIFERVSPAVVNISVTQESQVRPLAGVPGRPQSPLGPQDFGGLFGQFFGLPQVPMQSRPMRALGSGLILDSDGYIVTNNHVIDGADSITVTLTDGTELDATLVGTDPKTDVALLKVSPDNSLTAVTLGDSEAARVGDWVLAIGNPFGLGGTATFGIISALGRDIQSGPYDNFLQIDAPINSGNSGGPVFNVAGEVIGVNTAIFSPNGGNVGIGFAIPSAQLRKVVDELKENGHVTRGWLGVQIQEIDGDLADSLGMDKDDGGALVAEVVPGSPADKADLRTGDVVTAFDGEKVDSPKTLSTLVADAGPDDKARITILRDGNRKNLTVRLTEADLPEAVSANGHGSDTHALEDKLGLSLSPLNGMIRQQLGLDEDVSGLVVTAVDPNSEAARKGMRRGDLIVSVDGRPLDDMSELEAQIRKADSDDRSIRILVRRGDGQRFIALGLA
jgi:serine protease Do